MGNAVGERGAEYLTGKAAVSVDTQLGFCA